MEWALAAGLVIAAVVGAWAWIGLQGRLALRAAGARPIRAGELPRLTHMVSAIARDLDMAPPSVWVIESDSPNAITCHATGPCVAVSVGLLEQFSRTELEAVVAHCLLRIARGRVTRQQLALAFNRPSPGAHVEEDDVAAAGLTLYPPALASALRKCVPAAGRFAPLYFAGDEASLPTTEQRAEIILDL